MNLTVNGKTQPLEVDPNTPLLKARPKPTDDEIAQAMTNLCRCGTYQRVKLAIRRAAHAGKKAST